MKRVILDIILLISVFLFSWWITLLLGVVGMFAFRHFYEGIIAGFLLYILYSVPSTRIIASPLWFPVILIGVFFIITLIKKFIIIYK